MTKFRSLAAILLFLSLMFFFAGTVVLGAQNFSPILPAVLLAVFLAGLSICLPVKIPLKADNPIKDFKTLLLLLAVTILPRVIWIAGVHPTQVSDFKLYNRIAESLAAGTIRFQSYIRLYPHTLGYPFVLSRLYRLFGSYEVVAQIFNLVLFVGIVVGIYWLACQVLDRRFATLAGLIVALWPSQLFYTTLISTEAFFTFLLIICIGLFYSIKGSHRWLSGIVWFALLGVMTALMNTIRPFGPLFLIAAFIDYFVFCPPAFGTIKLFSLKSTLFVCLLASFFLTSIFIQYLTERAVQGSVAKTSLGYEILVGSNGESGGMWNQPDSELQSRLYQNGKVDPGEVDRILLGAAIERIRTAPEKFLKLQLTKNKIMWQDDRFGIYWNKTFLDEVNPGFVKPAFLAKLDPVSNIYYYTILICCILGSTMALWKREQGLIALVGLIILGMIIVFVFTEVQARYHYPGLPLFALLAAFGLNELNRFVGEKRREKSL